MQLKNKRIIVTGGAQGIGAAVVRAYVAEGAKVVSLDVEEAKGRSVAEAANAKGPGCVSFHICDVSKAAAVNEVFKNAVGKLGGLDVLVHVAGVERSSIPAEQIKLDEWELLFAVNAQGTFLTNQAAFPHLQAKGGAIINFASAAGVVGMPQAAHYAATKGAVLAWSRTVAMEWARYGIRVNCICPAMATPMYEAHRSRMSKEELAHLDASLARTVHLGGKLGNPDRDMAPFMVFLAGDGAGFITGQTLAVDGGLLMTR